MKIKKTDKGERMETGKRHDGKREWRETSIEMAIVQGPGARWVCVGGTHSPTYCRKGSIKKIGNLLHYPIPPCLSISTWEKKPPRKLYFWECHLGAMARLSGNSCVIYAYSAWFYPPLALNGPLRSLWVCYSLWANRMGYYHSKNHWQILCDIILFSEAMSSRTHALHVYNPA